MSKTNAHNSNTHRLMYLIYQLDNMVFGQKDFPIRIIRYGDYFVNEKGETDENVFAVYVHPPYEAYVVYELVVDSHPIPFHALVSMAAHEVRHRVQRLKSDQITFSFREKIRKMAGNRFLNTMRMIRYWLGLRRRFLRYEKRCETDAYFIEKLAKRDYKKHKNLHRIAELIQL